ncbi:MAG: GGDEF domain-containing protein [Syntrophomonadaceae bacterium]|nr:GGDEF domain-containing protein [Syntrophomonadaceae bacterium]
MLLLAASIGVVAQNEFVSINPYVIAVFAIAAIMINPPIENMVMLIFVYAAFFYALPYYQANNDVVVVLRINAFIMNVLAWVLSRFVFRMKVVQFLDKKIIEAKNSELIDMTNRDAMTFLFNHNNCYLKLGEEIERAKRIGYPMCVIFMDIDDFKQINDLHGHQAGDEVIIEIARILKDTCRSTDILCRYGGEEFAIIIPDTSLKDATSLAERIRININNTKFFNGAHVTVSGGISEFTGESVEELIRKADLQLYKAKCNGKNRFETDYSSHST